MMSYEQIYGFRNGFSRIKLNDKYGFINKNYEQICPIIYDDVWNFKDDYGIVSLDGKEDYIDHNGNILFDFKYDTVYDIVFNYMLVSLNQIYYVINKLDMILLSTNDSYSLSEIISINLITIQQNEKRLMRKLKLKSFL